MGEQEPELEKSKVIRSGAACSVSGKAYEETVAQVICSHTYQGTPLVVAQIAGSSHGVDVQAHCAAMQCNPLRVEVKSTGVNGVNPDWGQISVKCIDGCWSVPNTSRSPEVCKAVFAAAFGKRTLWDGENPLAAPRTIAQLDCERASGMWKDIYITDGVAPDSIHKFYQGKGCEYLQIKGKGLYSLGTDSWGLDVPVFDCRAQIRVRVKTHKSCTSLGHASLSVTAALQPIGIKHLNNSPYTLDGSGYAPNVFTLK